MQYLALTIGPVVKTLMEARKTRELWAGSFLLSKLMEHICEELDPDSKHLIIPSFKTADKSRNRYGAGLYPDRLFMKADGVKEKTVDKAIDAALQKLAEETLLSSDWQNDQEKGQRIKSAVQFWKQFFRIRYVLKELQDINSGALSRELTPYLENAELEDTLFPEEPSLHELYHLFEKEKSGKLRLYQAELSQALKGAKKGTYGAVMAKGSLFPSTNAIAALELYTKEDGALFDVVESSEADFDEEEDRFYELIEAQGSSLKPYAMSRHKYYCIVQADGDNIGKVIQQLDTEQDYKDFSARLAQFGLDAAEKINEYGGKPIYIGGDDLLFLAPVMNDGKSIFNLVQELDQTFPATYKGQDISLSYGINMVYYKFPLFEAIGDAYELLAKSKAYKNQQQQVKNALSFQLTKHSGSFFNASCSKEFLAATVAAIHAFQQTGAREKAGLISSLMFKVNTLRPLLNGIAAQEAANADEPALQSRLQNFFEAFFNEWESAPGFKVQSEAIIDLLLAAYKEAGLGQDNWLKLFYAVVRVIDFITEPNEIQQHDFKNKLTAAG